MKRKKGFYSISVVAKMFEVHQQTVRMYEKEGLLTPKRSAGNTRLFSEEDVDRLEEIIYLTHKMGVNLAGVEMILKLKKKIEKLQTEMNAFLDSARATLDQETEGLKGDTKVRAQRLLEMKREAQKKSPENLIDLEQVTNEREETRGKKQEESFAKRDGVFANRSRVEEESGDIDDWKIEYDDEK